MRYRKRRRDDAPRATLAAVAIVASLLAFHWFLPGSSESPLACRGDCPSRSAVADGAAAAEAASTIAQSGGGEVPPITAKSAVIVDEACGEVIFAKEPHLRLPPASITKVMTAVVALETADADDTVEVNIDGYYYGDSTVMGLETGMRLSLRDLLYGLLLPSGNDAAVAIARYVAGDLPSFVARMNAKVRALGLQDTHFTNPHGLDAPGHYSSAYDMAMLARYAMKNPLLAEIVRTKIWQPAWDGPQLWNGNLLLWVYPESDGVKIGWTENARQTIVASAQRDGRRLFLALLGSDDRYGDATRLLDWVFDNPDWGQDGGDCSVRGP
jgi:D-alanyl-D-alanine carboxypeptidase